MPDVLTDPPDPGADAFAHFSDVALARLALSSALAELSEQAGQWVAPRQETSDAALELLDTLAVMAGAVDAARTRAVIYARERNVSWADIADALGVTSRSTPQERYAGAVARWREQLYAGDLVAAIDTADPRLRARTLDRWVAEHHPSPLDPVEQPVTAALRRRDPRTATTAVGASNRVLEWSTEQTNRSSWRNARIRAGDPVDPAATAAIAAHGAAADAAICEWQHQSQLRQRGPWTAWLPPYRDDDRRLSITVTRADPAEPEGSFRMRHWRVRVDVDDQPAAAGTIDVYDDDDAALAVAETLRLLLDLEHIRGDIRPTRDLTVHNERMRAVLRTEHRGDFAAVSITPPPVPTTGSAAT